MNLCVFGAASNDIDKKYIDAVEKMGKQLADKGHSLVFGAGGAGLMGAAARGFKKGNAEIIGVIPTFFKEADVEVIYSECNELIFTESMRERKAKMEDLADAFIIVPGGIGTFEEFFEVLTLKQLARHNKPIVIYNIDGYYDSLKAMMEHSIEEGFVNKECRMIYGYCTNVDDIEDYIIKSLDKHFSIEELKK